MVLINHNNVHWKRISVQVKKGLFDANCQINDNVCKLFHSLYSDISIIHTLKMFTHIMPKVIFFLFSSLDLAVYSHFFESFLLIFDQYWHPKGSLISEHSSLLNRLQCH